jgi:hypothetical protein
MKYLFAVFLALLTSSAYAATIGINSLVNFVVYIVIVGLILWLLWWLIGYAGLPEPFSKVARVALAVIAVLLCINLLLGLVGTPLLTFR